LRFTNEVFVLRAGCRCERSICRNPSW